MSQRLTFLRNAGVLGLTLLSARAAAEAPPEGAPPKPADVPKAAADADAAPTEAQKQEAREHFEKGVALFKQEAWAPALAEFYRSRELFPTRQATRNAAIALRKLLRFDDSLDMYEVLLRNFPNVPADIKAEAQREIAELRALVGTIEIAGAEPGAAIVISGQARGEYPPVAPLRVAAGAHLVRIFKEGYNPFEAKIDVAGGETKPVVVKLQPLSASGRLKVVEQGGRALEVVVDGAAVGVAPWEGSVSIGKHVVLLRSSQGKTGTQPVTADVRAQQVTALSLPAEELESSLHVEPTPAGADVAIDSVSVGHGTWIGRVRAGKHRIEIRADGFTGQEKVVTIEPGGREVLKVGLERDNDALVWRKPSRFVFDVSAGLAVAPSFGGLAGNCQGTCARSVGLGPAGMFHASYELGNGLGFGLSAGYLLATQSLTQRGTVFTLNPRDNTAPSVPATADDELRLSSFLGGVAVSYRIGESVPILIRLGGGAMVGQVRDERTRASVTPAGSAPYPLHDSSSLALAVYGYVAPEVRVGYRFKNHFVVGAGVEALALFALGKPTWNNTQDMAAGPAGLGNYQREDLMGDFPVVLIPSGSFRYDF